MVWLVEKKVFYHAMDMGFERVTIPILTTFEFEVREGDLFPDSMSVKRLYNRPALTRRYPNLRENELDGVIDNTVRQQIHAYMVRNDFL